MASGVKCDGNIPDLWKCFQQDTTAKATRKDFTEVSISGETITELEQKLKNGTDEEKSEATAEYEKIKKNLAYCNYMLFHVYEKKEIRIEKAGELKKEGNTTDAQSLVRVLPEDECRYATYKLAFTSDGRGQNKISGFLWNPDRATTKPRMIYASSKDELKKKLTGLDMFKQADDCDSVADIFDKISNKK